MCKTLFPAQAYSKGSSGFRPPITRPPTTSPTPKYYSQRTSKRPTKPKKTPGTGGHPIYGNLNPVTVIRSVFKAKKKQQQQKQQQQQQQQQQKNRVYEGE